MAAEDLKERDDPPGLAEAFDWRTGRTWAVFLGYAAFVGIVGFAIEFGSAVPSLEELPNGKVMASAWGGALLALVLYIPVILLLAFLTRSRASHLEVRHGLKFRGPFDETYRSWSDLGRLVLWYCAFGLTYLALHGVVFGLMNKGVGPWFMTIVFGLGVAPIYMPGVMARWAARKTEEGTTHG